jgi:hypothetical protein
MMTEKKFSCRKCGNEISPSPDSYRSTKYCGPECETIGLLSLVEDLLGEAVHHLAKLREAEKRRWLDMVTAFLLASVIMKACK